MKQDLITEEQVFSELKKAIVETLRVDEGNIKPESSLIKDLGAESLDFLDVNYRLEQALELSWRAILCLSMWRRCSAKAQPLMKTAD